MSKRAFNKIMQGVEEARAFFDGTADKSLYRVHIKRIKPTLDEKGPAMESKLYRPGASGSPAEARGAKAGPRSNTGKPGMRRGWKPRGR